MSSWTANVNLRQLIGLHFVRFVGIYFLVLGARGRLPLGFARPAGVGDIIIACGAVFLLVKDGRVFFARGYGYSDLMKRTAVDPAKTVFRVGSVSKLFTATAVLQLAERGEVDLHTDVNRYLKTFQLEENFPAPVTLANLLTHTGGFDDRAIGIAARNAQDQAPLGEYLARSMPPRVRPPGEMYNYSSHGIALAGYIVETVSGQPFGEYVEKNILEPLEMRQSSFSRCNQPSSPPRRGSFRRACCRCHPGTCAPVPS